MFSKKSAPSPESPTKMPKQVASGGKSTFSVIGSDITVTGDIDASADLHIDGKVEGDIACCALVQGETSVVTGSVTAETARLAGTVKGSISARELVVLKSARIHGDVQYDALTIEQGAEVDGRFAPKAAKDKPAGKSFEAANSDSELKLSVAN
ncbi:polymer-forming cytoskeletal protein [Altererythrobacter sp. HHU K3-1]|uniref:Polymer-forming cytoskeletal protein n=2 Tax=Qipengyuania atrilutea TaxID=2744473 RepID=A0A850GXX4_9SPHN|nr:polymer-forming cytoskeletal protein [Actirhodobacter atriluteus]